MCSILDELEMGDSALRNCDMSGTNRVTAQVLWLVLWSMQKMKLRC